MKTHSKRYNQINKKKYITSRGYIAVLRHDPCKNLKQNIKITKITIIIIHVRTYY